MAHANALHAYTQTDTDELFAFAVNWDTLDKYKIAETKMRPWIQKKLIEYLGEVHGLCSTCASSNLHPWLATRDDLHAATVCASRSCVLPPACTRMMRLFV